MQSDPTPRPMDPQAARPASAARRREILKQFGKGSLLAGAASPLPALASGMLGSCTGGRPWSKSILDVNKNVQASISGMGSILMSAQACAEVRAKRASYYSTAGNWPSGLTNGSISVDCTFAFHVVFKCSDWNAKDSNGKTRLVSVNGAENADCLLNKSLLTLCSSAYANTPEQAWCTGFANATKLSNDITPFPYTSSQVVTQFASADLAFRAAAIKFYSEYATYTA